MKLKDFVNPTVNRANTQISFNVKRRALIKSGLTPKQLLEMVFSEPPKKLTYPAPIKPVTKLK